MSLLAVEELRVRLETPAGLATVVDGIDYTVEPAEVFGVAGESGSGKTVSMLALLGLLPDRASVAGSARFDGRELIGMARRRLRAISGRELTMVFQDPYTSLHPMLSIGRQLTEHVRQHLGLDRRSADKRAVDLLREVRIPDPQSALHAFPHQFSGGMRQRIAIAIALACEPKLLIADEPTTALDVTVQAGILRLLDRLRREHELAVVLITHDLGVLSSLADRIAIFYDPQHPYAWGLMGSVTRVDRDPPKRLPAIPGQPPSLLRVPAGCHFGPRCPHAFDRCHEVPPLESRVPGSPDHLDRCWLDLADKRTRREVGGRIGLAQGDVIK